MNEKDGTFFPWPPGFVLHELSPKTQHSTIKWSELNINGILRALETGLLLSSAFRTG